MIAVVGKRRAAAAADALQSGDSPPIGILRDPQDQLRSQQVEGFTDRDSGINVTVSGAYKAQHDLTCSLASVLLR